MFNSNIRRPFDHDESCGLPVRASEGVIDSITGWLPSAVGSSLNDEFKAAAIVSILRIVSNQVMHSSGAVDRLEAIKKHMTKNNNKLNNLISMTSKFFSYAGRPLAHGLVEYLLHSKQQYKRYTTQPNCPN